MAQESDLVKQNIDETRQQLTEKIVTLEDRIRSQVDNARERVRQLNPRRQIETRPLVALGVSVATGILVGGLAARRRRMGAFAKDVEALGEGPVIPMDAMAPRGPGLFARLGDYFGDEIRMAKGLAMAGLLEGVRRVAKTQLPKLSSQLEPIIDSAKRKVTDNPIPGERGREV